MREAFIVCSVIWSAAAALRPAPPRDSCGVSTPARNAAHRFPDRSIDGIDHQRWPRVRAVSVAFPSQKDAVLDTYVPSKVNGRREFQADPPGRPKTRLDTIRHVRREISTLYHEGKHGHRDVGDVARLAHVLAIAGRLLEGSETHGNAWRRSSQGPGAGAAVTTTTRRIIALEQLVDRLVSARGPKISELMRTARARAMAGELPPRSDPRRRRTRASSARYRLVRGVGPGTAQSAPMAGSGLRILSSHTSRHALRRPLPPRRRSIGTCCCGGSTRRWHGRTVMLEPPAVLSRSRGEVGGWPCLRYPHHPGCAQPPLGRALGRSAHG